MKPIWIFALQFSFIGIAPAVHAQALEETTALLNDSVARTQAIQDDPEAKAADQQVKNLGLSSAGEAKVYDITGKILEKMTKDSGGDSEKMNAQVQDLIRNPASLEKELSPQEKAQIHDLSLEAVPMRQAK